MRYRLLRGQTWSRYLHTLVTETPGQPATVGQCLSKLVHCFRTAGVSEPASSAEYIVAHAMGSKTLACVPDHSRLSDATVTEITRYRDHRLQHLPIQYMIGEWDFHHLTLSCKPPVFIPRPETEELVGLAMMDPVVSGAQRIIEIGPGTGAISLYLLHKLKQLHMTAIECSEAACDLTNHNARILGVRDRLDIIHGTFTGDTMLCDLGLKEPVDAVISNPPYIPSHQLDDLQPEIARYESKDALDGGATGLDVVNSILQVAALLIKPHGSVWLEVDSSHPRLIQDHTVYLPRHRLSYINTYTDLNNMPRFCHLQVKS